MKTNWKLLAAASILTGMMTLGAGSALARGYSTFSIGTTFGSGHHHGRGDYGYGFPHHGSHSNFSIGFSTVLTGNPYYSGYDSDPYPYYAAPAYYPSRPVYAPPPAYYDPSPAYYDRSPAYYDRSPYNSGYQQSAYTPPAESCLQTREYQTQINVGGEWVPAYGTACLKPDGSWEQGPAQLAQ